MVYVLLTQIQVYLDLKLTWKMTCPKIMDIYVLIEWAVLAFRIAINIMFFVVNIVCLLLK